MEVKQIDAFEEHILRKLIRKAEIEETAREDLFIKKLDTLLEISNKYLSKQISYEEINKRLKELSRCEGVYSES